LKGEVSLGRKTIVRIVLTLIISVMLCTTFDVKFVAGWSNGGYGGGYGTHDWIAQHALDWLPDNEKEYILENLDVYLYGTELPDRSLPEGYGDSVLHHIYYWSNGSLQDDASAVRAREMYEWAVTYVVDYHNISGAVMCLGIMSHYIVDVGVFGHVMGSGTDWGPETHHEDYETYVNERTNNYNDEFNTYLAFDGDLSNITAYDAARVLAYDTTFDDEYYTCVWMDQNYNWGNINFKNRCGQSSNLCVNLLADVLHTFYEQVIYASYSVAFIYSTNLDSAQSYKTLLEAHDIAVDLVPNSTAETWDYSSYELIFIGDDTGSLNYWEPAAAISVINSAGKPILGLGEGGYAFFGKLSLHIGYGNGWHGLENSIYVIDAGHQIFNYPTSISIPPDRIIQLYDWTSHVGIDMPHPVEGVTPLGRESTATNHYPLIQEDTRYVLWGFSNAPADMTQTGKDLFVNVILWLSGWTPQSTTRYPWPMFHHDLTHTGYSDSPAPNTNQTLWSYTTGNSVFSSPAVVDGKVYVGSMDCKVYCLDALTGAHIWNYTTGNEVWSSPAVVDGRVYVGSWDNNVYCLDAYTGAYIWSYLAGDGLYSSPAVAGGKVYVGSGSKVYCLDALTGAYVWSFTTGDWVDSSPAVADGKVYVGSEDHKVYCLDALTGAYVWSFTTGDWVDSSPAVADGKVYVGSYDHNVYCLDASTGEHIWNYTTGDCAFSSPAIVDGRVYVGSGGDYNVYCLDALTGTLIWNYATGSYVFSSPAVADGKVYVGSSDRKVYCLDALTGAHIWNYTTGYWVWSSPAVADGVVFVGSYDGKVYAFGNVVRVTENIQEAIDNAPAGTVLIVAVGVYDKSLVINKPLTLLGEKGSNPIFNGGGSGIAVTLLSGASGSTIAGIMITSWDQGILINGASNCKIYDNIMTSIFVNGIGIEGASAINNQIYSNIFEDNAVAINLFTSSAASTIYKNIITSNTVGLSLLSGGNIIYANTISDNDLGIDVTNSANNVIYHNNFANKIENAIVGAANNVWDNGYPSGGNYWSTYAGIDNKNGPNQNLLGSDGIGDTNYTISGNNIDNYPLMQPFNPHDIGIVNIITKTVVGQGFTLLIDLKILNYGIYDETFTVTVYANTITIATQTVTLITRNSKTIAFNWDTSGFAKGNYTIKAYAWPVGGENDLADNTLADGSVVVTIPGDIDGSFSVDGGDLGLLGLAWYTKPGDSNWNPNADIDGGGLVDGGDLGILGLYWFQTDP
jgi:parallel beta-helix repeat protein